MSGKLRLTDPICFSPTEIVKLVGTVLQLQLGSCCLYLAANVPVGADTQTVKFLSVA